MNIRNKQTGDIVIGVEKWENNKEFEDSISNTYLSIYYKDEDTAIVRLCGGYRDRKNTDYQEIQKYDFYKKSVFAPGELHVYPKELWEITYRRYNTCISKVGGSFQYIQFLGTNSDEIRVFTKDTVACSRLSHYDYVVKINGRFIILNEDAFKAIFEVPSND